MKGSCLCGRCVFEIKGATGSINKCHCTKCRKVSGTGSNAVFWIEPDKLYWVSGKDQVKTYAKSDGWESVFCKTCGSPLPRDIPHEEWIVPAGLMDENPQVEVRAHMFVENKPDWEVIGDDAPQFPQLPFE